MDGEIDLKDCPFCGGAAEPNGPPKQPERQWIACSECGCQTSTRIGLEDAIAAWNTRAPDPAMGVLIEATASLASQAAEIAELRAREGHLRAALATSKDPCVYCQLPAAEMAMCKAGFPGCARMDDLTGCPEFGSSMNEAHLRDEIASLRAELEMAEGALAWIEHHYANQDMKHVDFRVEAAHKAADALAAIREKTDAS